MPHCFTQNGTRRSKKIQNTSGLYCRAAKCHRLHLPVLQPAFKNAILFSVMEPYWRRILFLLRVPQEQSGRSHYREQALLTASYLEQSLPTKRCRYYNNSVGVVWYGLRVYDTGG